MLSQKTQEISVSSRGRGFYEITDQLEQFVSVSKFTSGLLTAHICHTSASLLIQENADPEVRRDLERFFSRLCPDGDHLFHHTAEGPDDMPAHIRSALTAVNVTIPVINGQLSLGTWQGLYVWEHRTSPHQRRIALHLLGA
jgi:secondary thiamine-phosphate synthase enzyme